MRPKDFDIEKFIANLIHSKNTIDDMLPDGMEWEDLTDDDHKAIDAEIFRCSQCGTWCPIDEEHIIFDEQICNDCL